eukprot:jgi/Mesvir1/22719/Mv14127-RA.1
MPPTSPARKSIVLVDGVCALCQGFVIFVCSWDKAGRFLFATQQSEPGESLLKQHGLKADLSTIVLLEPCESPSEHHSERCSDRASSERPSSGQASAPRASESRPRPLHHQQPSPPSDPLARFQPYTKSTAVLRIMRHLSFPVCLLYGLIVVPACIRDPAYDLVASVRYRLFGTKDVCALPSVAMRVRELKSPLN